MTTITRTNENGCDFPLFKTPLRNPLRTPLRTGMLSSATLNDLASYSNSKNKHLKFVNTTSMNDLQMSSEGVKTPIRLNKNLFSTPASVQRRRALGLVSHNNHQITRDDLSGVNTIKEYEEPIVPLTSLSKHPEDDLPHTGHVHEETFDDLLPKNERIERMLVHQTSGINLFSSYGGRENTIRCQSPIVTHLNVATLLDMIDI